MIIRHTYFFKEILNGNDIEKHRKELTRELGYIPQELAIHGNLKAWENVELFTSLYGIRGAELKKRIDYCSFPVRNADDIKGYDAPPYLILMRRS